MQLLYYHLCSVSMLTHQSWIEFERKAVALRWLSGRNWKRRGRFQMETWREKMNVGSAWSHAPKWLCQTVAMLCASIATATGIDDLITFFLWFPIGPLWICGDRENPCFKALTLLLFFYIWYRNTRSESCPFCRGSLKRVNSGDLWVLTCRTDELDTQTMLKEDMLRFHLYIKSLPRDIPDALFLMYYEYLF